MNAACYCIFKRHEASKWETGIAIVEKSGKQGDLAALVCVVANTTPPGETQIVYEFWDYKLDWTQSMYAKPEAFGPFSELPSETYEPWS